jgi:hypothetical protein
MVWPILAAKPYTEARALVQGYDPAQVLRNVLEGGVDSINSACRWSHSTSVEACVKMRACYADANIATMVWNAVQPPNEHTHHHLPKSCIPCTTVLAGTTLLCLLSPPQILGFGTGKLLTCAVERNHPPLHEFWLALHACAAHAITCAPPAIPPACHYMCMQSSGTPREKATELRLTICSPPLALCSHLHEHVRGHLPVPNSFLLFC